MKTDKERIETAMKYVIDSKTYEKHINDEVHLYGLLHQLAFLKGRLNYKKPCVSTADKTAENRIYSRALLNNVKRLKRSYNCRIACVVRQMCAGGVDMVKYINGRSWYCCPICSKKQFIVKKGAFCRGLLGDCKQCGWHGEIIINAFETLGEGEQNTATANALRL